MKLSSNITRFYRTFGIKGTIDAFAKAGVEGIDFNNDLKEFYTDEHDKNFYLDLKNYAQDKGVKICQAHAPFARSGQIVDVDDTPVDVKHIIKSMENASYLGAPMIVVHPSRNLDYNVEGNLEKMFEHNYNFYKSLIPYAEEFGIKVAIENIGRKTHTVTSTPERLIRLYDELNNPAFTICFDVGHCLLQEVDPAESIKKLGNRLVNGCTHIHDNDGISDLHTLPYYGKVEWDSVCKAFAEIGYNGNLSYEASSFIKDLPVDLYEFGLQHMSKVGHYLIDKINSYK